jgi:hypothetical protein
MKNNVDSRYLGVLSEVKSAMQPNGKGMQATILSSKGVATGNFLSRSLRSGRRGFDQLRLASRHEQYLVRESHSLDFEKPRNWCVL